MELITGEKFKSWDSLRIYYSTNEELNFNDVPHGTSVVVTHNSDHSVSDALHGDGWGDFHERRDINAWFANNCDVADSRIYGLPLGLENSEWHPDVNKLEKIQSKVDELGRSIYSLDRNFDFCAMFSTKTYPLRQAFMTEIRDLVGLHGYKYVIEDTTNGVDFDRYIDILSNSIISVCPRGNGLDTHRFWESCYLGAIPYTADPMYLLIDGCTRFKTGGLTNSLIDVDKKILDMQYWRERIYNAV